MKNLLKAGTMAGALLAGAAHAQKYHWYNYVVDSGTVEGYNQVRFDSEGTAKIVYRYTHFIRLAEFDGKGWRHHFADSLMTSGQKLAMDLDSKGNPHIIREDYKDAKILYAHFDGTKWKRFDLDTTDNSGQDFYQVSVRVDEDDLVHAIYSTGRESWHEMTYATLDKDFKRTDPAYMVNFGGSGKWNSLTFDEDGSPVAAFFRHNGSALYVGWRDGGEWKTQQVKDSLYEAQGFYSQIQRWKGDEYIATFHDREKKHLLAAIGTPGGEWKVEKIDSLIGWTQMSTPSPLAIAKGGVPVIAYSQVVPKGEMDVTAARLHIAYRTDSGWVSEVVDSSAAMTGLYASLSLTPDSLPAISYWNRSKTALQLAVGSLSAPPDEDEDGTPDYKEKPLPHTGIRPRTVTLAPPVFGAAAWYDAKGRRLHAGGRAGASGETGLRIPARGAYFGAPEAARP